MHETRTTFTNELDAQVQLTFDEEPDHHYQKHVGHPPSLSLSSIGVASGMSRSISHDTLTCDSAAHLAASEAVTDAHDDGEYVDQFESVGDLFKFLYSKIFCFTNVKNYKWKMKYYFYIHLLYIILLGLLVGTVVYLAELKKNRISYVDALYMAYSACCLSGLLSTSIEVMHTASHIFLFAAILLGGLTVTPLPALLIKIGYAYQRMVKKNKQMEHAAPTPKSAQKEVLGTNIELWAYIWLLFLIVSISFLVMFFGFIALGIAFSLDTRSKLKGFNPWWAALFLAVSAFNNCGMFLIDANLFDYVFNVPINLIVMILIAAGNTFFPIILRSIIYAIYRVLGKTKYAHIFKYMLDKHHHMSLYLFPSFQTKIYGTISVILLLLGSLIPIAIDHRTAPFKGNHFGRQLLIASFLAFSCRAGGFMTADISALSIPTLSIYIVMMRIKPQMACALREHAYSITEIFKKVDDNYVKGQLSEDDTHKLLKYGKVSYVNNGEVLLKLRSNKRQRDAREEHKQPTLVKRVTNNVLLRAQKVVKHLWYHTSNVLGRNDVWLALIVVMIASAEWKLMQKDPVNFTLFRIIFEVVTAFGGVGVTMGYPGSYLAFSSVLTKFSKMMIVIVMIFSRHRGLYGSMVDQQTSSYDPNYYHEEPRKPEQELRTVDSATDLQSLHSDTTSVSYASDIALVPQSK